VPAQKSLSDRIISGKAAWFVVFIGCVIPFISLVWRAYRDQLGPNPIEYVTHATGTWTLRFVLITLLITPARKLLSQPKLIRFRRMLGLYAFFYGSLHLMTYVWFDKFFDTADIAKDIVKRPFITVGFLGFVLMVPLAITSTAGWIRRLGGKQWQLLHRLIYITAIAGVVHYLWLVKSDIRLPAMYGAITAVLLSYRIWMWLRGAAAKRPVPVAVGR